MMKDEIVSEYKVNRSVKYCTAKTGVTYLYITKKFAEDNLSKDARKLASRTRTHYIWIKGKTDAVVLYELPKLFNAKYHEIFPQLVDYCMSYIHAISYYYDGGVVYLRFLDNYNK